MRLDDSEVQSHIFFAFFPARINTGVPSDFEFAIENAIEDSLFSRIIAPYLCTRKSDEERHVTARDAEKQ
jgi:hypothetical protein